MQSSLQASPGSMKRKQNSSINGAARTVFQIIVNDGGEYRLPASRISITAATATGMKKKHSPGDYLYVELEYGANLMPEGYNTRS